MYDLFLVYNKTDADLVHHIIAPMLRSKPYNFRVALEHDDDEVNVDTRPKYKHLENLLVIAKQSEHVLFLLSKNLFTSVEYDLIARTPKIKRLAMLMSDEVCESIAEQIIQPCRIIKPTFNLNSLSFDVRRACSPSTSSSSSASPSSSTSSVVTVTTGEEVKSCTDEIFFESSTVSENSCSNSRIIRKKSHHLCKKFEF